jgi:hypothetical protein
MKQRATGRCLPGGSTRRKGQSTKLAAKTLLHELSQ